jgi:hypothetical protein
MKKYRIKIYLEEVLVSSSKKIMLAVSVADVLVLADYCILYKCAPSLLTIKKIRTHRSKKYRKIKHVRGPTQITHPVAEAEHKTLLLFVNIKQE